MAISVGGTLVFSSACCTLWHAPTINFPTEIAIKSNSDAKLGDGVTGVTKLFSSGRSSSNGAAATDAALLLISRATTDSEGERGGIR